MHLSLRQFGDAGEDIGELGLRDGVIELGGVDEGIHRREALPANSYQT